MTLALTAASLAGSLSAQSPAHPTPAHPTSLRVATYNVSLFGKTDGEIADRLSSGEDAQAQSIARVIASVDPTVLLLCEIDHVPGAPPSQQPAAMFVENYLAPLTGAKYPDVISFPANTGVLADVDVNGDGRVCLPLDGHGFGKFEGQYGMAVVSRLPIDRDAIRTFQTLLWSEFRSDDGPISPDGSPHYPPEVWRQLRLSSKNHVDVPVQTPLGIVHLLASHPTPPVFDGPEDRNGMRNADEIRFWTRYIDTDTSVDSIVDDAGRRGGLSRDASFVIAGDLNSDPVRGDSDHVAITELLGHRRVNTATPLGPTGLDTTAYFGRRPIRVDYLLPSANWTVVDCGVIDPPAGPAAADVAASDHRLVWMDLVIRP